MGNKSFIDILLILCIIMLNMSISAFVVRIMKDGQSSRIEVYIDTPTGCQYLIGRDGSLIPRVFRNGNHVCLTKAMINKYNDEKKTKELKENQ